MQEIKAPALAEATIRFHVDLAPEHQEVALALLSETSAYAFEEKRDGLHAYFSESQFDEQEAREIIEAHFPEAKIAVERIAPRDWNAEWERDYASVLVDDFVEVHPPFRQPSPGIRYAISLMPRMAFGTGHHSTTWLMLQACQGFDFQGKKVLDMGCGTAVLGILASMLGAAEVMAIDIDPWSEENAKENAAANGITNMQVRIGDAKAIPDTCYDIILANINRNVLLADRDAYFAHLAPGGLILLSGMMDKDESMVDAHYRAVGLEFLARNSRNEWIMLAYKKDGE